MSEADLPLLNMYEVEIDGAAHHLVAFLDVPLAGIRGIDSRAVVGEFTPGPDGQFSAETFQLNPEFVGVVTQYMNEEQSSSSDVVEQAAANPSAWLYVVDPRHTDAPGVDPSAADVVGCFAVDDHGQVVPNSFQYNREHLLFHPEEGISGLLGDRRFYDWLHPIKDQRRQV